MHLLSSLCCSHKTSHFSPSKDAKIFEKRHSKSFESFGSPTTVRKPTLRWLRSFLFRNAVDGKGSFLRAHIGLKERLTNDHLLEIFFSLCESHSIREAIIGEQNFSFRKKLIRKKKRFSRDKSPRITERNFCITVIYSIFVSNINRSVLWKP